MKTTFATLFRRCAAALALGAALAGPAHASTVLYSQAPKAGGFVFVSGEAPGVGAVQNAESFNLAAAASVTAFRWYGSDLGSGQLVVRLFNDLVGASDTYTTLTGAITQTAQPALGTSGLPIFEFDMTLSAPVAVAGGHDYFLSVFAPGLSWGWLEGSGGNGTSAFRFADGHSWQIDVPDLSLSVIGEPTGGTTPEPTTFALAALALAAAAGAGRSRSAAALAP